MSSRVVRVLMDRDNLTRAAAEKKVLAVQRKMKWLINKGDIDGAYNACSQYLGLEPDYIDDLIW